MGQGVIQPSFTGGEISPSLYGRVDLARYYTSLKTCRNFIVRQFGGITNRGGLRLVGEVADSTKKTRLLPFQFNTEQAYALELCGGALRVIKDGAYVVKDGGIYSRSTPYTEEEISRLKYTQSADVMTLCHPQHKPQQLSRTDHNAWGFADFSNADGPFAEVNSDTTLTIYSNSVIGDVTVTASSGIFTADMVGRLLYVEQSPDGLTRRWEVQKSVIINDIRRAGSSYYQALASGTTGTVRPSVLEGVEHDGDPGVQWKYLHSGFGIVRITGYTSPTVVSATVLKRLPDQVVTGSVSRSIEALVPGNPGGVGPGEVEIPVQNVRITISAHGLVSGNTVTVTGVTGTTGANGTWQIIVIDVNTFDLSGCTATGTYTGGGIVTRTADGVPTYKWALEAWGGAAKYPGAVHYHQQRQVFGGSYGNPQGVWFSTVGGYASFEQNNPILDDDAIRYSIVSRQVNEVRHFVELSQLIALTSGGPFTLGGGDNSVLTPSTISAKRQSGRGASHVPPVVIGERALYVQDKGTQVRSLGYSFQNDAFIGEDLTLLASHLFYGHEIVDWAYQENPYSCIWAVRSDGALLGLTYLPEQEVVAWHRHDTPGGLFESVCVISEGEEDAVYFVVKRGNKRYVERMESRKSGADAFFVDAGLTYDGRNTTAKTMTLSGGVNYDEKEVLTLTASSATFSASDVGRGIHYNGDVTYRLKIHAYTSPTVVSVIPNRTIPEVYRQTRADWTFAAKSVSGLSHLEGQTVKILADGFVQSDKTVSGGSVTLDFPAGVVHVGLGYLCEMETMEMNAVGSNVRDKEKLVNSVGFLVQETAGIKAGSDASHLYEFKGRTAEGYDEPTTARSGLIEIPVSTQWNKGGRVFAQNADPLPVTILAVIPDVTFGGR